MLDIPQYMRRLRIVTIDQVALAMAGLSGVVNSVDKALEGNYIGCEEADIYKKILIQAIQLKEIKPTKVLLRPPSYYELPGNSVLVGDVDSLTIDSSIVDAEFFSADAWAWAEKELSFESPNVEIDIPIAQWDEFAGKNTALMFIAGMAIALTKSSPAFKHGSKMNKDAIANAAIKAINDYGKGTMITPKSLTNLIKQALEKHIPNLD